MSRLKFSGRSQRDLERIGDHTRSRNPEAARRWVDLLEEKCRSLAKSPRVDRERPDLRAGLRGVAVGNYVIIYRPIEDGIEVVRVLHGARDLARLF